MGRVVGGLFAVELGGKRGARLQPARARTAGAEGELRRRVAGRASNSACRVGVTLAAAERRAPRGSSRSFRRSRRWSATLRRGAVTSSEVARTRGGGGGAERRHRRGRGALEARAALAAAIGVPPRALDRSSSLRTTSTACAGSIDWGGFAAALALTRGRRWRARWREYAFGRSRLRLAGCAAVSRSRAGPGIHLGPGRPSLDARAGPAPPAGPSKSGRDRRGGGGANRRGAREGRAGQDSTYSATVAAGDCSVAGAFSSSGRQRTRRCRSRDEVSSEHAGVRSGRDRDDWRPRWRSSPWRGRASAPSAPAQWLRGRHRARRRGGTTAGSWRTGRGRIRDDGRNRRGAAMTG